MGCDVSLTEKERFPFIDGLRGAAILWVVLHHGFYFFIMPTLGNSLDHQGLGRLILLLARCGFWGVHLFFVISGFLITGLLMGFLDGRLDLGRFYLRRSFKILPHYYFVIGLVFISFIYFKFNEDAAAWIRIFPYLFFFQNYSPGVPWLDHSWSLVVEEQFYIFWSFFLFFISKYVPEEKDRWGAAVLGAVLIVVLTTLNRFFLFHYGVSLVYFSPMQTHLTHATSVIVDGLMMGCILRLLWSRYPEFFRNKKIAYLSYVLGVFAFLSLLVLPLSVWGVPGFWYSVNFAWFFSICFIIAGLGGVTGIFDNSWLRWTGKNSYGIYLIHYPLVLLLQSRFLGGGYLLLTMYVFLAVGLGSLTTATIEKYFLNIRKRIAP